MEDRKDEDSRTALPQRLAKPAQRALANAGIERLDQLTKVTEADVAQLHGMGPNGIEQLRVALAAIGLSFAAPSKTKK